MTKNEEVQSAYTDSLRSFGLTEKDTAVYLFLLERGIPFAGAKIAARFSFHRQYVYTSLKKLIDLQLVEQIDNSLRPKFQALPPQQLTHLAKKRLLEAEDTARELNLISAIGANQDFEIYRGARQVADFEENLVHNLPEGETQYIIGGGAEAFVSFFGERYEEVTAVAKDKKLTSRYVGCLQEKEWLERAKKANYRFEYRILPAMPKTIVQTAIRMDSVTFYSFGTPPLVSIVKSKTVYGDYKKFFEMLWNMGGKG